MNLKTAISKIELETINTDIFDLISKIDSKIEEDKLKQIIKSTLSNSADEYLDFLVEDIVKSYLSKTFQRWSYDILDSDSDSTIVSIAIIDFEE